jgi:hypothetical protein
MERLDIDICRSWLSLRINPSYRELELRAEPTRVPLL